VQICKSAKSYAAKMEISKDVNMDLLMKPLTDWAIKRFRWFSNEAWW